MLLRRTAVCSPESENRELGTRRDARRLLFSGVKSRAAKRATRDAIAPGLDMTGDALYSFDFFEIILVKSIDSNTFKDDMDGYGVKQDGV